MIAPLSRARAALLVVDLQERLARAMPEDVFAQVLRNTGVLIEAGKQLGLPIVVTQQYPKGLGATVPGVEDALAGAADVHRVDKLEFSAAACGEVAHPGFGSRLGPQPEADAGGGLFPADQGLAEQALVLPETLGAGVGGAGHVADDRCCGCGQVHDRAPWVAADACHLHRHNPKLGTIVQSQGAA